MALSSLACSSGSGAIPTTSTSVHDAGKDTGVILIDASTPEASDEEASIDSGVLADGSFDLEQADNSPMQYYGGPVLAAPINVYVIYYGNWLGRSTTNTLEYLISNIDQTSVFKINNKYWENTVSADISEDGGTDASYVPQVFDGGMIDGGTAYVSNTVTLAQSIYAGYPYGTSLAETDIVAMITADIANNALPLDTNGVYFVFTSADVTQYETLSQQCWDYCGWHNSTTILNTNIKYAFVGDTEKCPGSCSAEQEYQGLGINNSPNNDWSADGMAPIIEHELSEMATDPDIFSHAAWIAEDGAEIGDLCAYTYGQPFYTDTGSVANIQVGDKQFLLQQLYDLDDGGGHCALMP